MFLGSHTFPYQSLLLSTAVLNDILVIYIVHIGKGRPLLKTLHDHVVMKIADRWKDLGLQLLQSDQQYILNIIATNHSNDAVKCCKCFLKKWLETAPDATWNQLIEALRSPGIQLIDLADQIEQMIKQCKIYNYNYGDNYSVVIIVLSLHIILYKHYYQFDIRYSAHPCIYILYVATLVEHVIMYFVQEVQRFYLIHYSL